jgi:hypothetical protein
MPLNCAPGTGYRELRLHQITAANMVVVAINASELKHNMQYTPSTRASM